MITYFPATTQKLHKIAQQTQDALNDYLRGEDLEDVLKHVDKPYYVNYPVEGVVEIKVGDLILITITKEEQDETI